MHSLYCQEVGLVCMERVVLHNLCCVPLESKEYSTDQGRCTPTHVLDFLITGDHSVVHDPTVFCFRKSENLFVVVVSTKVTSTVRRWG